MAIVGATTEAVVGAPPPPVVAPLVLPVEPVPVEPVPVVPVPVVPAPDPVVVVLLPERAPMPGRPAPVVTAVSRRVSATSTVAWYPAGSDTVARALSIVVAPLRSRSPSERMAP